MRLRPAFKASLRYFFPLAVIAIAFPGIAAPSFDQQLGWAATLVQSSWVTPEPKPLCRRALAITESVLKQDPINDQAYAIRARAKTCLGDSSGAREDVAVALKLNPGSPLALYVRSAQRRSDGDVAGAIADAEQMMEKQPDSPLPYVLLSLAFGDRGDHQSSLDNLNKAIHFASSVKPDPTISILNDRAITLYSLGRFNEAEKDLKEALRIDPNFYAARRSLAYLYYLKGVTREASFLKDSLGMYTAMLSQDPGNEDLLQDRAVVKSKLGDYAGAIRDVQKVLRLSPGDSFVLNNACWIYYESGDFKTALSYCNRAIQSDPTDGHAYDSRGYVLLSMGQSQKGCRDLKIGAMFMNEQSIEERLNFAFRGRELKATFCR